MAHVLGEREQHRRAPGVIDTGNIAATLHPTQGKPFRLEMDFLKATRNRAGWNAMNRGIVL
jgi:hypothetical protein